MDNDDVNMTYQTMPGVDNQPYKSTLFETDRASETPWVFQAMTRAIKVAAIMMATSGPKNPYMFSLVHLE